MLNRNSLPLLAALSLLLPACLTGEPASDMSDEGLPPRVSPVEQFDGPASQFAFRAAGEAFHARSLGHRAVVEAGSLRLTPLDQRGKVSGPSLEIATASIRRGESEIAIDPLATTALYGDALEIRHGPVVEVLENRREGVEQSWVFDAEPKGTGDLAIDLRVASRASAEVSASGLRFSAPGASGFLYSHGVWIDARGQSWHVPVSWDGRQIVLRVPDAVLEHSAYPAVLDPIISNDTDIDRNYVPGRFGAGAREPSIASVRSDGAHLIVWSDDRMNPETDIYTALISESGVIWGGIRNGNLQVSDSRGSEQEPVVALIKQPEEHWLVAWTAAGDISAATVGSGSAVVQLGTIARTTADERHPAITSSGDDALLVWQSGSDIRGARFAAGAFGPAFDIAATGAIEANPSVARSDDPTAPYLVVWEEGGVNQANIRGQLVTTSSTLSGPSFDIAVDTGSQMQPVVVRRQVDDTFVVAWRHRSDIRATRVTPGGQVLDETDGVGGVVISAGPTMKSNPTVACELSGCLVAWEDRRDLVNLTHGVYGQRFSHAGTLVGDEIAISDGVRDQVHPAVAPRSDGGYRAVWETHRVGEPTVVFTGISANGFVGSPDGKLVPRSYKDIQRSPAYALSASSQLAVYTDFLADSGMGTNMARLFDASGQKVGDGAIGLWGGGRSGPSVDFDGSQYLAVFSRVSASGPASGTYDIGARRVTEAGERLDPTGVVVNSAVGDELYPDVASSGEVSLVAWEDRRDPAVGADIRAAVVAPDGTVTVADIPICLAAGDQERPAIAWDPTGRVFVVAWSDRRDGDADIYAARVAPDGSVLDAGGILASDKANQQLRPAVATSGGQLLLVWEDRRAAPNRGIHGTRLTTGGALSILDPGGIAIATGSSDKTAATVVGVRGQKWAVAWTDDASDAVTGLDIHGQTVLASGALDGAEFVIAAEAVDESEPSFQAGVNTGKRVYLVYQRPRFDPLEMRVARRFLTY